MASHNRLGAGQQLPAPQKLDALETTPAPPLSAGGWRATASRLMEVERPIGRFSKRMGLNPIVMVDPGFDIVLFPSGLCTDGNLLAPHMMNCRLCPTLPVLGNHRAG